MVRADVKGHQYLRVGIALVALALVYSCNPNHVFDTGEAGAGGAAAAGESGETAGTSGTAGSSNVGGHTGGSAIGGSSTMAGETGLGGSPEDGGAPAVSDPCSTDPCINGGVCSADGDKAVCACSAAYTGEHCETNVDDCASNPCQNGGTCIDGTGTFTCSCSTGFSGEHCERAVSKCQDKPCLNGGTCADQASSYKCTCPTGYSGTNCEINVDDCAASPCKNGAACTDGLNTFTCQCKAGYSGTTCQTNIDDCAASPCLNGSTCVDGVNAYTCQCKAGYTGTTCQTNVNDCSPNPCQNSGTCTDGVNAHTCTCTSRYTGPNCEYLEVKLAPDNLSATAYTTTATALSNDGKVLLFQYEQGTDRSIGRLVDFDAANLLSLSSSLDTYTAYAHGIDNDGATIVGSALSSDDGVNHAFKQVGAASTIFDVSQVPYNGAYTYAEDVSADGTMVVGNVAPGSGIVSAFYCKGAQACKTIPVQGSSWLQVGATSVNGDGSVMVGWTIPTDNSLPGLAWRWLTSTAQGTALSLSSASWTLPRANAVSRDGLVVVGEAQVSGVSHAVRWSGASLTPTDLGTGRATATSADGSVTVGVDNSSVPLVWLGTTRVTLASLLGTNPDLTGATLTGLVGVSDNGKVVGGTATVGGVAHAFMAHLP